MSAGDDARYDDRETALILRMAAELDHRPAERSSARGAAYSTAAWWGTRRVWRRISNRVESRLSRLMDAVTDRAASVAKTSPAVGDPDLRVPRGETRAPPRPSGTVESEPPTAPTADESPK